jgi:hypothetical protein
MLGPLEDRIGPTLPGNAVVLSGRFPLPRWQSAPDLLPAGVTEGAGGAVDGLWVYRVADNISRSRVITADDNNPTLA